MIVMSEYNQNKKKFPYFVGIGMILVGVLLMIFSGRMDEGAQSPLIFIGVLVFIGGFAATVIYSTQKNRQTDENGEKKPRSRTEKVMWIWGAVCLAGLLVLIAGFVLFKPMNMLVVVIGMALFLVAGSVMMSIFSKHSSEFLKKEDEEDPDKKE